MSPEDTVDLELDDRPGYFYVSVIDGGKSARLRGPFTTHGEALNAVDPARDALTALNPQAHFYAYGTCRCDEDLGPGYLDVKERTGT